MWKMDEMILVVERKKLFDNEKLFFEWVTDRKDLLEAILNNIFNNYTVMKRWDAEENQLFKQPIPYLVLKKWDEFFLYERLINWWEKRLHNLLSIWIWWHMNFSDAPTFNEILLDNLNREIEEELFINSETKNVELIWLINDESNEVWKVHLWVLYLMELSLNADVSVKEIDALKWDWKKISELTNPEIYWKLESWSKISVDILK